MMVVEALHECDGHVSAEEIFTQVKATYPYANISTVYRTLELLKELGLAAEIDLGDGIVRYHAKEDSRHHHLICNKCGRITQLPEAEFKELDAAILRDHGFKADLSHLAIFGLCKGCLD